MFEDLNKVEILMLVFALAGIIWGIIKLSGDKFSMEGV